MPEIHAIILTLNEELHIARCIKSLGEGCASITVVDSGSKDATTEIAERLGAHVVVNPFINHATQMNFAIETLSGKGGWLLRIDADEVLDPDSTQTLASAIAAAGPDVDGVLMQRRIYFMGRRIRHGDIEPSWQLRLWRNGRGHCEQRWMDEHIKVTGKVTKSSVVFSDVNLNSITWWTAKHNSYASREAIDLLNRRHSFLTDNGITQEGTSPQAKLRRILKEQAYGRLPKGVRPLLYFFYRYIARLGFLDGKPGWYFHVLQAFWYRTLVDAKVTEIETLWAEQGGAVTDAIIACTGIDVLNVAATASRNMSTL